MIESTRTDEMPPEQRLYYGVLLQALRDALASGSSNPLTPKKRKAKLSPVGRLVRDEARHWFARANADFREVCQLAGFAPSRVRQIALTLIKNSDAIQ